MPTARMALRPAEALAAVARAADPYRVASEYGRLSERCVRCHADYRPANR